MGLMDLFTDKKAAPATGVTPAPIADTAPLPPAPVQVDPGAPVKAKFQMPTFTFTRTKEFLTNIVTPYGHVTKSEQNYIIAGWVILLGLIWSFSTMAFLPTPVAVWNEVSRMVSEEDLIANVWTSLQTCFFAIVGGTILSAVITYMTPIAILKPIPQGYTKLRYLSISGLTFYFTLLLSPDRLKVYLLMFSLSVFFITSFIEAIAMPEDEYIHARTLGLSRWQTLWTNVIVGKRDKLIKIMAQTFAILWMMLPSVEILVRSSGGLAILLAVEVKYFKYSGVVGIIIIIVGLGIFIDFLFGLLRLWVSPYVKYEDK